MRIASVLLASLLLIQSAFAGMDSAPQAMPPNAVPFAVETWNVPQATISAWHLPAKNSHGTVFVSHGFRNNKSYMASYAWIRDRLNWDMVYFDYREHGDSTHDLLHFPTLGYYEIWDAKAVVDWAEARGLPRPYVMMAPSMGGAISLRFAGSPWAVGEARVFIQGNQTSSLDASRVRSA